jgi:hypothetical protein
MSELDMNRTGYRITVITEKRDLGTNLAATYRAYQTVITLHEHERLRAAPRRVSSLAMTDNIAPTSKLTGYGVLAGKRLLMLMVGCFHVLPVRLPKMVSLYCFPTMPTNKSQSSIGNELQLAILDRDYRTFSLCS